MLLLLGCLVSFKFGVIGNFEPFPEDSDEYLAGPSAFVFSPRCVLYLVDSNPSRIHVWDEKGQYKFSFGTKGEGPGEFLVPTNIDADERFLWVLDSRGTMSRLDHSGKFIKSFRINKPRLRRFSVLDENLFMVTTREQTSPTEIYNRIELLDGEGQTVSLLKKWLNESFTTPREGANYATVKAYPPACEIQKGVDGRWYFGFSQTKKVYAVNKEGKIAHEIDFGLPAEKATDDEKAMFKELAIPCIGGGSFVFKNFPNIRTDFRYEKAHYTRYAVKGDRVIFGLTPDGGVFGCEGYPSGNYFVCDFKSGKILDRGYYDFPEGSLVFFRNDRILGLIIGEDGDFEVRELGMAGAQGG